MYLCKSTQLSLFGRMDDSSLTSVIMPVRNSVGCLHKCVESVRCQFLKEIEIILVDNLSNDGFAKICDEYARIDSLIKVLHLSVVELSL